MPDAGHPETVPDAPPILSNVPGSFAWGVFHQRHPALVKRVRDAFPYPLDQDHALDRLGQESSAGVITPLGRHAPDREVWDGWGRDYLIACLRRLRRATGQVAEVGRRLWQALRTGQLAVRTHTFSCAPWSYHHMPADLVEQFSSAALTIMKGDLNYRRLVGDCYWPPATPFAPLTRYFPGPVAALRTLKSDVIVGLDQQVLATLDSTGEQWRTNGTHALIQVRP